MLKQILLLLTLPICIHAQRQFPIDSILKGQSDDKIWPYLKTDATYTIELTPVNCTGWVEVNVEGHDDFIINATHLSIPIALNVIREGMAQSKRTTSLQWCDALCKSKQAHTVTFIFYDMITERAKGVTSLLIDVKITSAVPIE